jgi:hypothetical protein
MCRIDYDIKGMFIVCQGNFSFLMLPLAPRQTTDWKWMCRIDYDIKGRFIVCQGNFSFLMLTISTPTDYRLEMDVQDRL